MPFHPFACTWLLFQKCSLKIQLKNTVENYFWEIKSCEPLKLMCYFTHWLTQNSTSFPFFWKCTTKLGIFSKWFQLILLKICILTNLVKAVYLFTLCQHCSNSLWKIKGIVFQETKRGEKETILWSLLLSNTNWRAVSSGNTSHDTDSVLIGRKQNYSWFRFRQNMLNNFLAKIPLSGWKRCFFLENFVCAGVNRFIFRDKM